MLVFEEQDVKNEQNKSYDGLRSTTPASLAAVALFKTIAFSFFSALLLKRKRHTRRPQKGRKPLCRFQPS
jgi:hypothetical protein